MKPKIKSEKANHAILNMNPSKITAAETANVARKATGALPYFADSFPEGLRARNTPIDEESRMVPSVALEIWRYALISGIRATKDPTPKPLVIKVSVTASLARFN